MSWPAEGAEVWAELVRHRDRIALVLGESCPALRLAEIVGVEPCRVGTTLTALDEPPDPSTVADILSGERVLVDLDVLFAPQLELDPIALLHDLGRRVRGLIAVWPGNVVGCRATYSTPERFDWYDSVLTDTLVLRARPVVFPDETPFTIERIP